MAWGNDRGVKQGNRQKSDVPRLLPIAPYPIKNKHSFTICILLVLRLSRHWQAAGSCTATRPPEPIQTQPQGKDLWSFHLEGLAVPSCLLFYNVL